MYPSLMTSFFYDRQNHRHHHHYYDPYCYIYPFNIASALLSPSIPLTPENPFLLSPLIYYPALHRNSTPCPHHNTTPSRFVPFPITLTCHHLIWKSYFSLLRLLTLTFFASVSLHPSSSFTSQHSAISTTHLTLPSFIPFLTPLTTPLSHPHSSHSQFPVPPSAPRRPPVTLLASLIAFRPSYRPSPVPQRPSPPPPLLPAPRPSPLAPPQGSGTWWRCRRIRRWMISRSTWPSLSSSSCLAWRSWPPLSTCSCCASSPWIRRTRDGTRRRHYRYVLWVFVVRSNILIFCSSVLCYQLLFSVCF